MKYSTQIKQTRYQAMAPNLIRQLEKRNYEAFFCATAEEAAEKVMDLIPEGSSVSWGGSVTLNEIGIKPMLKAGNYRVLDREEAPDEETFEEIQRQALTCDVFLSSVNAMSEAGDMVNIDGTGNRVAAIAYGPKKVILVVGMNKVCRDLEAARVRARTYAAPNNGFQFKLNLPCYKTGGCHDCFSPESMCSLIVEMRRSRVDDRIKVILVGEDLGY